VTARTEFAYVQARLHARHARLAGAAVWQALEASRTAAHYLAQARAGPLAEWVDELDAAWDVHRIERGLRARWHRYVDDVARWLPPRWQAATRWFGTLTELPLIDALRGAGPAATWQHADERLAAFTQPEPSAKADALRRAGLVPFATPSALATPPADPRGPDAMAIWHAAWLERVPPHEAEPGLMSRPAALLLPRLLGARGERSLAAEPTRRALSKLFRRHAGSPVAVFAHLALVALDVERLRGGLVARRLFEPGSANGSA
jgi:hypothetical protein